MLLIWSNIDTKYYAKNKVQNFLYKLHSVGTFVFSCFHSICFSLVKFGWIVFTWSNIVKNIKLMLIRSKQFKPASGRLKQANFFDRVRPVLKKLTAYDFQPEVSGIPSKYICTTLKAYGTAGQITPDRFNTRPFFLLPKSNHLRKKKLLVSGWGLEHSDCLLRSKER